MTKAVITIEIEIPQSHSDSQSDADHWVYYKLKELGGTIHDDRGFDDPLPLPKGMTYVCRFV